MCLDIYMCVCVCVCVYIYIHAHIYIPGEGNGNPLQYPCLEKPMDRGAWRTTVHGFSESDMTEVT